MKIVTAGVRDVAAVAALHLEAFPGFFLTSLGKSFLEELYSGFLSHPSGMLLVAKVDGIVVGFVAGTTKPELFFRTLRRRRGWAFVSSAMPSLVKNPLPVIKKLLHAFRFGGGETPDVHPGSALLSSIGVAPSRRGSGFADAMITAFENAAKAQGAYAVYLTTDVDHNERVNAFYRKHGYVVTARFLQGRGRTMFRYEKPLSVRVLP